MVAEAEECESLRDGKLDLDRVKVDISFSLRLLARMRRCRFFAVVALTLRAWGCEGEGNRLGDKHDL